MPPLHQQVVLITGASSGIGAALAQLLADRHRGIRLVLAARTVAKLDSVAAACRDRGADVLVVPTDMTETAQVQALAQQTLDHFGRVDGLVNNAGYGQMGPVELIPVAAVRQQLEVNVVSVLTLTQALLPAMRHQGGGRIINLSSVAGQVAFPFSGVYNASKFALEGVSDALRMEVAPFGIGVSLIEPGPVKTEFFTVARTTSEAAIANPQDSVYHPALAQLDQVAQQFLDQAWSVDRVAEVIHQALGDRHPKPRYVAADYGSLLLFCLKTLPTAWVDGLWKKVYGLGLLQPTATKKD
ncbi:SDR family oxidoreductase [Prochlorothrix hollandica]|uniref:Short-chain dehydrogenase n=1 Tax=Prochlorothrix hollandica PCC 9006 = CALU 1027 TaxID=317619 RepID=A0A0M2PNB8_PROHO|nr:SDR family oxidoreductase [Prochlorothrix hollandica]KKI98110.1 short-chain dehydrogenase [Prochlorothrix hollandica PCC 9006 = CALU 1027]